LFDNRDIHVHVPEGATPKDGPASGVLCKVQSSSGVEHSSDRRGLWFWEVPRLRPLTAGDLQPGVLYEVTIIGNEVVVAREVEDPGTWQTRRQGWRLRRYC
jgi:hypothetical protein